MKKGLSYIIIILTGLLFFSCSKDKQGSLITKPLVTFVVDSGSAVSGGTTIALGPVKKYEQGSDVVYTFTVSSGSPLSKFIVSSSSDVFSKLSKVIKTEPAGVIDTNGNFTQPVQNVKIYYAYRIDPLVPAGSNVTVTFNFQNQATYVGTVAHSFTVIKINSTMGKRLQVLDFSWPNRSIIAMGTQDNFAYVQGIRAEGNNRLQWHRPPFISFDLRTDLGWVPDDVIAQADKMDLVGFRARYVSSSPTIAINQFYVVSPSYIEMLGHMYIGSQYLNLAVVGTNGTAQVTAAGLTLPLTYATSTTVTATNFVNANKAAYAALGLTLSSSGATLIWTVAGAPAVGTPYDPVKIVNVTGDLTGNPAPQQGTNVESMMKDLQFRDCLLKMDAKLKAAGSGLRIVRFKRLDNITGPSQVTIANFNSITYDNEFATIMNGISTSGKLYTDPLGYSQVWGFVMSDGRAGLLRTGDNTYTDPVTGAVTNTDSFLAAANGGYILEGIVKVQQK